MLVVEDVVEQRLGLCGRVRDTLGVQVRSAAGVAGVKIGSVAAEAPTAEETAANTWLPEHELRVYSTEYERTGFQGGLQWYRCAISPEFNSELALYSGRTIDVPSYFISGSSDWGHYQRPGALEAMQSSAFTDLRGCTLVEGAGHWVQQEQPAAVADHVLNFLRSSARVNGD